MSRGPALCLLALVALTACGGGKSDAPAKPQAAPAEPAVGRTEAPAETATPSATAVAPAAAAPAADQADAQPNAATPAPTDPPYTQGTSLPGAIPPSPAVADTKQDKAADPLVWMRDKETRRADYQRRLAEAEAGVASGNASIGEWERNILAFKNPFRPRPQLSAEDAQAIEGKDGVARVSWAEGKLAAATAARDAAQKTLDDLKANPPSN